MVFCRCVVLYVYYYRYYGYFYTDSIRKVHLNIFTLED